MLLGKTVCIIITYMSMNATIASEVSEVSFVLRYDIFVHSSAQVRMWVLPCQCVVYNNDFNIFAQGQDRSPAYHLPSFSSSESKMSPRPVCFSNWPLLMKPSVGVQSSTALSFPDVSSHFKATQEQCWYHCADCWQLCLCFPREICPD